MRKLIIASMACCLAAAALFTGCGAGTSGGAAPQGRDIYAEDIHPALKASCGGASCHDTGAPSALSSGLVIPDDPSAAYTALMSSPGMVVAGNAEESDLVTCITARSMPIGRSKEPIATTLAEWINGGAPHYGEPGEEPPPPGDGLPPINWGTHTEEQETARFVADVEIAEGAKYAVRILGVQRLEAGGTPIVKLAVVDPTNGDKPYENLLDTEAWPTSRPDGDPRPTVNIEVLVAWNTADFNNDGGSNHGAPLRARLSNAYKNGELTGLWAYYAADKTYYVNFAKAPTGTKPYTAKTIPADAKGTGLLSVGGRQAFEELDESGNPIPDPENPGFNITLEAPIRNAFHYFSLDGSAVKERRTVVDNERCLRCHGGIMSFHGMNRNGDVLVCLMCHNPNQTDIESRKTNPGEESVDFKYMVHAIHAGSKAFHGMRDEGYVAYGRGGAADFAEVFFPSALNTCEVCHLPGTWALPDGGTGIGVTVLINDAADTSDDERISPKTAICYACHQSERTKLHAQANGGLFNATQAEIDLKVESCAGCHFMDNLKNQHSF